MNKTWTTILSSTVVVSVLGGLGTWSVMNYNRMHDIDQQRVALEQERTQFATDRLKAHDTDQASINQRTDALNAKELDVGKKINDLTSRENDVKAEEQAVQAEATSLHARENALAARGQAVSSETQRAGAEAYIRQRMTEFDQLGINTASQPPCSGPLLAQYNRAKSIVSDVLATATKWQLQDYMNWAMEHGNSIRLVNSCN